MTDAELIKQCLQGEVEAFKKIMDRYNGKAMALALNVLRSREDAEDVCQDVFIRIYFNLDKIDPAQSFKSWFYAVLSNRCRDYLRKKYRFQKISSRLMQEAFSESKADRHFHFATPGLNKNLLHILSPKERIVLFLWAQEGYSGEEIASVLKCSPSTARVHLFKARKKIKSVWEKNNAVL